MLYSRPMSGLSQSSACSQPIHPQACEGILLFNRGKFFEAHEALEVAWKEVESEIRDLYRGILQIAVAYVHITRGNYEGATKVYARSQKWLIKWPDFCQGVNLKQMQSNARRVMDEIERLGPEHIADFDRSLFLPIQVQQGQYFCDRCGHEMVERNCKVTCSNCGNRFDCSDLNIYFD